MRGIRSCRETIGFARVGRLGVVPADANDVIEWFKLHLARLFFFFSFAFPPFLQRPRLSFTRSEINLLLFFFLFSFVIVLSYFYIH